MAALLDHRDRTTLDKTNPDDLTQLVGWAATGESERSATSDIARSVMIASGTVSYMRQCIDAVRLFFDRVGFVEDPNIRRHHVLTLSVLTS